MNATLLADLRRAHNRGVPIVAIASPDQPTLSADLATSGLCGAVVGWDMARGLYGMTEKGAESLASVEAVGEKARLAAVAMVALFKLKPDTVVVAQNLARHLADALVAQAVLNLRDVFKSNGRMLVILGPDIVVPAELRHDVITMDDPMPDEDGYASIVAGAFHAADIAMPLDTTAHVSALRGLSGFEAEQVAAMALTKDGIAAEALWQHTAREVSKVKGLTMTVGGPPLSEIKGMDHLIATYTAFFNGPLRPRVGVLMDEVEKMMAGLGHKGGAGDNTGVAQDALLNMLGALEDKGWGRGSSVLLGVPGSGKTNFARALFAAFGCPLIRMDLGAMTGSLKGQSEAAIREALRTIASVGGDRVAFIATCNRSEVLPAEFKRRFRLQTWYSDVAGREEKDQLWGVYLPKYGFSIKDQPTEAMDDGFTGANIRDACELAYSLEMEPNEAASRIIPIEKSDPDVVEGLRNLAAGRYLDVARRGCYRKPGPVAAPSRRVNG